MLKNAGFGELSVFLNENSTVFFMLLRLPDHLDRFHLDAIVGDLFVGVCGACAPT